MSVAPDPLAGTAWNTEANGALLARVASGQNRPPTVSAARRAAISVLVSTACSRMPAGGKFDVVMACAIDRSALLIDLLGTIQHLETVGVDLYLDQQRIDITTPQGKLLFQSTGTFAAFERSMIEQRVRVGLKLVRDKLARDGKFETRRGIVRTKLGRPGAEPEKIKLARRELAKGTGIIKAAKLVGLGVGTVHRLKREIGDMPTN